MTLKSVATLAREVFDALKERDEKVVFAESCTAGNVSAELAKVPRASDCLCGSFVTYRPKMKRRILGVKKTTLKKYTAESPQTAKQMAIGALERSDADWAVSVVGHFGPKSPEEKDGKIWVCVAHRGKKKIKCTGYSKTLEQTARIARCKEATLSIFRILKRDLTGDDLLIEGLS